MSAHSSAARRRVAHIQRTLLPSHTAAPAPVIDTDSVTCTNTSLEPVCVAGGLGGGQKLEMSDEVATALAAGRPVVALESTIISHGMPYPQNLRTAQEVEQVVRDNGATPATIAILGGVLKVGLSEEDLTLLAQLGPKCHKTSRRDIALVVSQQGNGATTVAATMMIAHMAGIKVFVTGGIGGVHRGAEQSMDVSADLGELARTPVAVVCAGAKSILDIGLTLEVLETNGVTVVGYGVDEFPAFFTRHSGFPAHCRLDDPQQCAKLIKANSELGIQSGMVIGVPVPESEESDAAVVTAAIDQALQETIDKGVVGRDITPYLLQRINELTSGQSLKTNIALVKNNARVGSAIAVALCE